MDNNHSYLPLLLLVFIAGCSTAAGNTPIRLDEIQLGRAALIRGEPELAIKYFNTALAANPDYANDFEEGPLTYRGRAHYELGKLLEAREDLTQALTRKEKDFMARLYLGLTLVRQQNAVIGDRTVFSFRSLLEALKNRVLPQRLAALVKERGIDFDELTEEQLKTLKKAGADNKLLEVVKKMAEERPRWEGLKNLERALREIQSWFETMAQTSANKFWDPERKISSQIETSLAMIRNKKADHEEFLSGIQWVGRTLEEKLILRDQTNVSS